MAIISSRLGSARSQTSPASILQLLHRSMGAMTTGRRSEPTFHLMCLSSKLGRADSYRPTRPASVPPPARIQPLDPDRTAPVTSGVDGKRNTVHPVGKRDTVRPLFPSPPSTAHLCAAVRRLLSGAGGHGTRPVVPPCAHQGHSICAPRAAPAGVAARRAAPSAAFMHAGDGLGAPLLLCSAHGQHRAGGPSCSELVHPRAARNAHRCWGGAPRGARPCPSIRAAPRRRRVSAAGLPRISYILANRRSAQVKNDASIQQHL